MTKRDELIAKTIYEAMEWACANNTGDLAPKWVEGGNSHAQTEARSQARLLLSSCPELGEQSALNDIIAMENAEIEDIEHTEAATKSLAEFHAKGGKTLDQVKEELGEPAQGFDEWFKTFNPTGMVGLGVADLKAAFTAGQAKAVAANVVVKDLVWDCHSGSYWEARPACGEYYIGKKTINDLASGKFIRYEYHFSFNPFDGHGESEVYLTIEAAQAAANAHHKADVLACIEGGA